ncbi:MAG: HlyD family efflux transporter periplasmic adaptor subunit [Acidobacteria bacterium]|nr:HlyD family efflux transporter periplasmic adaptor subunit [Acidobacteriota bacterium]MBI3263815.1 HlyD family efflux transporter periplasmic adaptor subunit [Acidobacteriota bacterium]
MDVARGPEVLRKKRIKQAFLVTLIVVVGGVITLALSRMQPAAPTVERATVWIDTVHRGPMIRQVRGLGTLVPKEIRWIPATTQGRVERRLAQQGDLVTPDTVILELSNPDVQQASIEAENQLKAAEAQLANLRIQLKNQLLAQQAAAATVQADFSQAKLQAESDAQLAAQGLIGELTMKLSKVRAEELATRNEIEQKRLSSVAEASQAQLTVQQAEVDRLRGLNRLRQSQVASLKVRAGVKGVLQQIAIDVGQQVAPGTNLARVSDPSNLKAELRIAETQAKDILINQKATVDTRNGVIPGHVVRIDPAAQNGTVAVDVELDAELPRGARPDLSVDGTIELERLESVLYVGRPAFGQESSTVGLFRLVEGGEAIRANVKLGRSSVNTVEILDGLKEGDQVILSDMSAQDAFDRIRLR